MSIADLRREYNFTGLSRNDLEPDPFVQFQKWFEQAAGITTVSRFRKRLIRWYKALNLIKGADSIDINAMTLATADREGRPSARIVLLKGIDERGFIFYTNYDSRKGRELAENPHASLVFYWPEQERQVSIAGVVSRISRAESEAYFRTRPRGSQIAAWASRQSQVVPDRKTLHKQWKAREAEFPNEVPTPPYWGGYVLAPEQFEFWQGRPNRLHDRFCYTPTRPKEWQIDRLSP